MWENVMRDRSFTPQIGDLHVLGSVLLGGILGEWWRIEDRLEGLGKALERRFAAGTEPASAANPASSPFTRGFVTASLVFCVGPMTILGSIQDGLSGDYHLLAIKSMLDGFAALAFASTLGVGVIFAALTVLIYQGGLSLSAGLAQTLLTDPMVNEMTAAGGVLILGISLVLLDLKRVRVANLLPAIFIAPAIVAILQWMGISI
ncbi:MAG TPA: DUF554 domain-containing protein [Anaerolineae bacterium]|nr:DUF554 domain-containing protein [Anaerolineae bacterium]